MSGDPVWLPLEKSTDTFKLLYIYFNAKRDMISKIIRQKSFLFFTHI